ncbi:MAG: PEP-CTERM sorting domain-containing protein [Armatimonadetes bacterium]|nr:PEP-CTERM sorting domain-containing protein [Armatimonadota bacterium]
MKGLKTNLCALALLSGLTLAQAQTITARSSTLNYFATYGHGGDVVKNPSDSLTATDLLQSDSKGLALSDVQNGTYLSGQYFTSVDVSLNHSYQVSGPVSNFSRIDAQLHSSFVTSASGAAGAGSGGQSVQPGNELLLDFTTAGFRYEFLGSSTYQSTGANVPHSKAELLKWNGSNWSFLESTIFSNGLVRTGTLGAGTYRLLVWGETKSLNSTAFANTTLVFKNLDAVPEPATLAILGASLSFVLRKKRR